MNSTHHDEAHEVRAFHERAMAQGQKIYFAVDHRGELAPQPDQRAWLAVHLRKAIRLLELGPDDVFVDLGCGEGYLTLPLSSRAKLSIGLDFSSGALGVLGKRPSFDARHLGLAIASGDAIPLPDASVDKLLCNHLLEHVLDDDAVIEDIRRVLRPGGRALVGVPLAFTPQASFCIRLRRLVRPRARRLQLESAAPGRLVPELIGIQSHIRFYSLRAIRALLERHGFLIVRAEGVGLAVRGPLNSLFRRNPLLLNAGTFMGRIAPSLGDGVLVLAERMRPAAGRSEKSSSGEQSRR